ncbi:MAG: ATP-binding protein [Ruminococcus sp.]|jgi:hypothetical protein|nr:ATP-binding protein [Ruminococcus sp.]
MALQIIDFINNLIINAFVLWFLNSTFERKFKRPVYVVLLIAASALTNVVFLLAVPVLNLVFTFLRINLISFIFYKAPLRKGFIFNQLFFMFMFCADIASTWIYSLIFKETNLSYVTHVENRVVVYLIYAIITFILITIFIKLISKKPKYDNSLLSVVILLMINIFAFFCVHYIITKSNQQNDIMYVIMFLAGFFLLDLIITYQFNRIAEYNYSLSRMESIKVQNSIQLAHYEDTITKYKESRKIIHDMRKHIAVLADLNTEDTQTADSYVKLIDKNISSLIGEFVCTNRILSIIMEQKINQSRRQGIEVNIDFEDITFDFMTDIDVTALFANLWDNAIEGAVSTEDERKFINVTIGKDENVASITFENSFSGNVNQNNNRFFTTKFGLHEGLGLQIVENTVTAYNGHTIVNHGDKTFIVSIIFTNIN